MNFTHLIDSIGHAIRRLGKQGSLVGGPNLPLVRAAPFDDRVRMLVLQLAKLCDYFDDRKP
jgi:hypothetical protein